MIFVASNCGIGVKRRPLFQSTRFIKTLRIFLTRNSCCTIIVAMKNVTITLDEKVAAWARIRAAQRETSVSRLVGEMLKEKMIEEESYQASMQHYFSQTPSSLKEPGAKYPNREEIHER
jgi:hypothetical protein